MHEIENQIVNAKKLCKKIFMYLEGLSLLLFLTLVKGRLTAIFLER